MMDTFKIIEYGFLGLVGLGLFSIYTRFVWNRGHLAGFSMGYERMSKSTRENFAKATRELAEKEARVERLIAATKQAQIGGPVASAPSEQGETPTPSSVDTFGRKARLLQARSGRRISARVALAESGRIVIDWQVTTDVVELPEVVGECDGDVIFREFAFQGRHPDQFAPGRHKFAFTVLQGEDAATAKPDLEFNVLVPDSIPDDDPPAPSDDNIETRANEFFSRNERMSEIKRKKAEELAARGYSKDEIDYELAKFEAEFSRSSGKPA